jgi:glycosyltransferase involved in cell wall biosynthesis
MVIDRLDVGGAERVALTLADTFLNQGHTVSFITIDNIKTIEIDPRIALFSLDFENRFNKYVYNRKKMHTLLDTIQTERGVFDFILVHLYKASRVMQKYKKVQSFHIMHSTQSKSALKDKQGFSRWLVKRKIQNVYNGLDIICVSKGVEEDLLDVMEVKPKSIRVIYNPFDIAAIRRKAEEPYNLPFNDKYIIYVGRLVKEKRVDYLLEAYKKSNITEKLLILGDGPELENLQRLCTKYEIDKNVLFLGSVLNPYKYIKDSRFLVLCSHHEGFGNVLVEALILQTPVISTNCPSGPKEILQHYTLEALVEDNFDNEALAEKIKHWSIAPVPVKKENLKVFSDINIAKQYIELYKSVN